MKIRNSTYINFGDCEETLKSTNGIDPDEEFILLAIVHNLKGIETPIIEYILFSPVRNKTLDISIGEINKIHIHASVDINEDDKCYTYSENGADKVIKDRKEFNDEDMSLCEKNCDFKRYNSTDKKIDWECNVKYLYFLFSLIWLLI